MPSRPIVLSLTFSPVPVRSLSVLLLLALSACSVPTPDRLRVPTDAPPQGTPQPLPSTPDELSTRPSGSLVLSALYDRMNATRREQGQSELTRDALLERIAQEHSADMARRGYFDHVSPEGQTPFDRADAAGIDCLALTQSSSAGLSENLYQMSATQRTATSSNGTTTRTYEWPEPGDIANQTAQGWLDSPGHRENLLRPSAKLHGMGAAYGDGEMLYVTHVFCNSPG